MRKGNVTTFIVIIAIGLALVFWVYPEAQARGWLNFGQAPPFCVESPKANDCVCPEGQIKQTREVGALGNYYTCEEWGAFVNPTDPSSEWEGDILDYAKMRIHAECPVCETWECPSPATLRYSGVTQSPDGRPFIIIECIQTEGTSGVTWWNYDVYMDTGEAWTLSPHGGVDCRSPLGALSPSSPDNPSKTCLDIGV